MHGHITTLPFKICADDNFGRSRKGSFLEVSNVSLLRFAWQASHFVTFRRVL